MATNGTRTPRKIKLTRSHPTPGQYRPFPIPQLSERTLAFFENLPTQQEISANLSSDSDNSHPNTTSSESFSSSEDDDGANDQSSGEPSLSLGYEDSVDFLAEMFSDTTLDDLETTLATYDGDMEKAVHFLLARGSDDDISLSSSSSDAGEIRSVTDMSACASSTTSFTSSSGTPSHTHADFWTAAADPETERNMQTLSAVFPDIDRTRIYSALAFNSNDMGKATEELLQPDAAEHNKSHTHDGDLAILFEMFPDRDLAELLSLLQEHGSAQGVSEFLTTVSSGTWHMKCQGDCVASGYPCVVHSKAANSSKLHRVMSMDKLPRSKSKAKKQPIFLISAAGSSIVERGTKLATLPDEKAQTFAQMTKYNVSQDPSSYRKVAQEILQRRNECFNQAAHAFKRGNLTGRGSAAYYSEEGRSMSQEISKWNELAAAAVVQRNIQKHRNDPNVLDLHELTVREAVKYALEAVNEWHSRGGSQAVALRPLKVITGAGNHSKGGQRKVYPAVWAALQSRGWPLIPGGSGWFYVKNGRR
ncbi:hypothetical protein DFS34DRAFT_422992 [Phlyctochytrium arcticum]|nr:hypothetical protein DFS34DRAFT_422992 [Phlyctochytrium arcticum]